MSKRGITLALLLWTAGCGDDNAKPKPDASIDAPVGVCGAGGVCDPIQQDCPGGARCALQQSTLVCDSAPGSVPEFQQCASSPGSDNCVKGTACLNTGTVQTCRKFCCQDSDCGANYCATSITGAGLFACAQKCDVLVQD